MMRTDTRRRIMVLGGYGNFGARICRALAKSGCGELLIAGRKLEHARGLAAELTATYPGYEATGIELDCFAPELARKLAALRPVVVVHTVGPFQGQDYRVASACADCGSHYIDLADARDFVANFATLDREARNRDVLLVSGASTLPGVSSAVIEALRTDLSSLSAIEISIAPAGRTARGAATVAAVLSYCGKPLPVLENGAWTTRYGWLDHRTVRYGSFTRRVAACDVPDLGLFPERYGARTVTFHAGPESRWQLAVLGLMATLTRIHVVRDWSRYARPIATLDSWITRFGSDTGAMQVRIRGTTARGEAVTRTWNLTAGRNHGPEIPCAPAIALTKMMLGNGVRERGAKPCIGVIDLGKVTAELADFDIDWQVTEERGQCFPPT